MQWRKSKKRGVSAVVGTLFFILIVFVTISFFLVMFNSFSNYADTLKTVNQQQIQQKETSFSVSGFAFPTQTASTAGTASGGTLPSVPITIINSQASSTPNPFQEKISWNPSLYSSSEATDLGNVRFCSDSSCNTQLYAWLESCTPSCSNTATVATAWVRLTTSIAANGGTLQIYMVFLPTSTNFDGNYWGEAPTLSGTYGQYDNGANVFTLYDNFAGTSLNGMWNTVNRFGGYTVNNGLTITTTRTYGYSFIYSSTEPQPQIAEAYMVSVSGDSPMLGVDTQSNYNNNGMYNGYSLNWYSSTEYFCPENSGGAGTCATRFVNQFPSGTWSVYWAARGNEGSTDGSGNTITSTDNSIGAISNYGIYLGANPNNRGSDVVQWVRMRAFPPNNVMPSASIGSFLPASSTATSYSFERKVVYSQNLWWAFYSDGNSIGYRTSPDGSTWSTENIVSSSAGAGTGYNFNIWLSGNTLYYILTSSGQSNSFLWRYGTLESTGSIGWGIPETTVSTTNTADSYASIVTDSFGNIWVALNTIGGGGITHIEVWEHSGNSWNKVNDISSLPADVVPLLLPTPRGVAMIYGPGATAGTISITNTTTANPNAWSLPISPPSNYAMFYSSAETVGNTIYFAGLASYTSGSSSGTVNFFSYTLGASSTSSETVLQPASSTWQVSVSSDLGTLDVFFGSGSGVYYVFSMNSGQTFNGIRTISASESSVSGLTSAYSAFGVVWISGSSNPFELRFFATGGTSISNSSPFPIHLISLYIYDTTAGNLIHFDTNSSAPGVSGGFDYWMAPGQTSTVPESFNWIPGDSYTITIATDQGMLTSYYATAPA